jgi:hypothetical protein
MMRNHAPLRVAALAAMVCALADISIADSPVVLVLYSEGGLSPASAAFTEGLRGGLKSSSVQVEEQHLDISRFAGTRTTERWRTG